MCVIEECEGRVRAGGMCAMHYSRWKRHGDPMFVKQRRADGGFTLLDRFEQYVVRSEDCWEWVGAHNGKDGYAQMWVDGKVVYAHRWSYEHSIGPIPDGLQLDHRCRNHGCVRPDHLEPVTNKVNGERGIKGVLTTHCPQGHEYTPENTYMHPRKGGNPGRKCRRCMCEQNKARAAVTS